MIMRSVAADRSVGWGRPWRGAESVTREAERRLTVGGVAIQGHGENAAGGSEHGGQHQYVGHDDAQPEAGTQREQDHTESKAGKNEQDSQEAEAEASGDLLAPGFA